MKNRSGPREDPGPAALRSTILTKVLSCRVADR
jgi:hypothetical protein